MHIFSNLNQISVFFSELLGVTISDSKKNKIGKLQDIFIDFEETYPTVLALQFLQNKKKVFIPWEHVKSFSIKEIEIKESEIVEAKKYTKKGKKRAITNILAAGYSETPVDLPPVGKVVLDRQIVDTHGKKVVRVNDIQFIKSGRFLKTIHATVGFRSIVRRLGYDRFYQFISNILKRDFLSEKLINWKYVHAIPDRNIQSNLKLSVSNEDIRSIHPADLADILEDLDVYGREKIFNTLTPEQAALTLTEIDDDLQSKLIKGETPEDAARIIENMGTDEAADILSELDKEQASAIISNIQDDETGEEIQELLEYEDDTAGGLMSSEVFEINLNSKKSDVINKIQNEHDEIESIYDIYIIDEDNKLVGTCPLSKILIQIGDIKITDIMTKDDIKSLTPYVSWKEVASFMSKYNLINVPIVDDSNILLGIISVDDVLPWLLDEK